MKIKEILDYKLPDWLAYLIIVIIFVGLYVWQGFNIFVLVCLTYIVYKVVKLDSLVSREANK